MNQASWDSLQSLFQIGISPGHDGDKLIELYGKSLYYSVDTVIVWINRILELPANNSVGAAC